MCQVARKIRRTSSLPRRPARGPGVLSPPSLLLLSLQPGGGLTRGAVDLKLREQGAGEPVGLRSRLSQKMGKRKKKDEKGGREGKDFAWQRGKRPEGQGTTLPLQGLKYNWGHKTKMCTKQRAVMGSG